MRLSLRDTVTTSASILKQQDKISISGISEERERESRNTYNMCSDKEFQAIPDMDPTLALLCVRHSCFCPRAHILETLQYSKKLALSVIILNFGFGKI